MSNNDLAPEHFDNVRRDLHRRFGHRIDAETVDRVLDEAIAASSDAAVSTFLPTLVDREASDRLSEMLTADDPDAACRQEIVYVSRRNAGRTQLAASITRSLADEDVVVREIGLEPVDGINPHVVPVLEEKGLPTDILGQIHLVPRTVHRADVVVLMGVDVDEIPDVPGDRYVHWDVQNPDGRSLEDVRATRDRLLELIPGLLNDMGVRTTATVA